MRFQLRLRSVLTPDSGNQHLLAQKESPSCAKEDRKSTRLNSSHSQISYAVFCLKKKNHVTDPHANIVILNALSDRLLTADPAAGAETRRTLQANDAHFYSLV